jgi:hypothetical protein
MVILFPSPTTPRVTTLNMILTQVRQSLELSDPLGVPGLVEHSSFPMPSSLKNEIDTNEHSSLSLSRLLKNETDPPPLKSSLILDHVA